ncbi:MAG: leucine-rich repeat protein [Clostridia bacterium]|nr:leucine-rich repeat protein [Clostridia bacterium]
MENFTTNIENRLDLTMTQAREKWSFRLLDSGNYKLTGFNCSDTTVYIPSSINGIKVESLREGLFENRKKIETVYISEGITTISSSSFSNCRKLKEVYYPSTLKSVEMSAFYNSKKLETFKAITESNLEIIKKYAFFKCEKLKYIDISTNIKDIEYSALTTYSLKLNKYENLFYLGNNENPYLVLIKTTYNYEKYLNDKNHKKLLEDTEKIDILLKTKDKEEYNRLMKELFDDKTTNFTIHPSTKIIYTDAFNKCVNLKEITIPDSVEVIKEHAFSDCENLTTVNYGKNLKIIEDGAFCYCPNLKYVRRIIWK